MMIHHASTSQARRHLGFVTAAAACFLGCSIPGHSATPDKPAFPVKPLRVLVATAAGGGGGDAVARIVGRALTDVVKQQVIIENRSGANGVIGTELAARSAPDGYTMLLFSFPHGVNPAIRPKLPYDTRKDFAPVTLAAVGPMLLTAHPSVPAADVKQLLNLARLHPDEITCASSGNGSAAHLALALMANMANVKIRHIPYKDTSQAATDVIGGQVSLYFGAMLSLLPHVKTGKLKALAVSTSRRTPAAPNIPTVAEIGLPGYDVGGWYGFVTPAGTPAPLIQVLNGAILESLKKPEVVSALATNGADVVGSTPETFAAHIDSEITRWGRVVKQAGITQD